VHDALPESQPQAVEAPQAAPALQQAPRAQSVQQPTKASLPEQSRRTDPLPAARDGLASDNAGTRIEAVRKLKVEALPELLALDIAGDPELAPTVIQVIAQLAQRAEAPQREAAVAQLTRWLKAESARPSADARGNVSVLVETLGTLPSPQAESALIEVLESEQLPLHVQTLAVEGLARFASPTAQAALQQFRAQLAQSERQGFELDLQREAEHATDRALARLSR
jgi:hypothetical protein